MTYRKCFSTGNPFERQIGFSRAVRVGNTIYTAGTIAVDEHGVTQGETTYGQAVYILNKLGGILADAGSSLDHVVKVTCFLIDLEDGDDFARAHSEFFGHVTPAATCVEVCRLYGTNCRIELELIAIVPD